MCVYIYLCVTAQTDIKATVHHKLTHQPKMCGCSHRRWLPLVLQVSGSAQAGWTLGVQPTCPAAVELPLALQHARVAYHAGDVLLVAPDGVAAQHATPLV